MSWAALYIARLKQGEEVSFRPKGNSMVPRIYSGQLVTVVPLKEEDPQPGDVVLCKVGNYDYLHLVKAIEGDRFKIGNNKGKINGWVSRQNIFGKCIKIEN